MTRKKLARFAELKTLPNVLEKENLLSDRNWAERHFQNQNRVILELGCGRGEYTIALAVCHPDRNVVGVDRKGARIWKGAHKALDLGLSNAAFLRLKIEDLVECLGSTVVEAIWIPFPDPLPKRKQAKHRIVSPAFLDSYRTVISPGGKIHFKTDDEALLLYLIGVLQEYPVVVHENVRDIHAGRAAETLPAVMSTYEKRHLEAGRKIGYVCFSFLEAEAGEEVGGSP